MHQNNSDVAVRRGPRAYVEVGDGADAPLRIGKHVGDPRCRLAVELHSVSGPLPRLPVPVRTKYQVAVLVTIGERADLAANLVLVQLCALRLPQQRLVIS